MAVPIQRLILYVTQLAWRSEEKKEQKSFEAFDEYDITNPLTKSEGRIRSLNWMIHYLKAEIAKAKHLDKTEQYPS